MFTSVVKDAKLIVEDDCDKATCLRLLCGAHAQSGYIDCLRSPPCKI